MNHRFFLPTLTRLLGICGVWLAAHPAAAAEPTKQDCVTASESAQDLRRAGKLREARAAFAVCTAASCPSIVREDCAHRLKEVEASLPTVVFSAKDAGGRDLSTVRVVMDGEPLLNKLDGTAIAVDPGEHHLVFEAIGFRDMTNTIVVREGDTGRSIQVVLASAAAPPAPEASAPPSDGNTQRAVGLALGASGVAGLAVGAVFGVLSKATYNHALAECANDDSKRCSPQAIQDQKPAFTQATVSTIAWIGGGALLAGGALLYFTAPRGGDVAVGAMTTVGGGGLTLRGTW
jgi:hypothetical protein